MIETYQRSQQSGDQTVHISQTVDQSRSWSTSKRENIQCEICPHKTVPKGKWGETEN